MQFIFACACGDIAFCPTDNIKRKNPATFRRVKWPRNVILGVTIETNRDDLAVKVSRAPPPSKRFRDFLEVEHEPKMVTHEPIMEFDLEALQEWDEELNPALIWIGYDSKRCGLPEPSLEKVKTLCWRLTKAGYAVILKNMLDF